MGWASYQEDNIDARGESKSRRIPKASRCASLAPGVSNGGSITRIPPPPPPPPQRPLEKTVLKSRFVTSDEIQRRIQQEIICQAKKDMGISPN